MNAKENRDELIKEFVTKIEGEPQLWQKCWQGKSDMAKSGATGKYYNGLNSILLTFTQSIQGYDDNRWYTFLEAKKQNASIKKGEKGSPAFFYKEYDKKTKSDFTNETVKDMTREERIKYMQENVVPVLNRFIVFNACQIDGIEKEEHKALMTEEQQRANTIMQAEHIIENQPCQIIYGGNRDYYSPSQDNIHLPDVLDFKDMQNYYATALHEIAHSTGHSSRLNRFGNGETSTSDYAMEELRAEMASVFVQNDLNIKIEGEHFNNHLAYVQAWAKRVKENPQAFVDAIKSATSIADYIEKNYAEKTIEQTEGKTALVTHSKVCKDLQEAKYIANEIVEQTGKPAVVIEWSEHSKFKDNTVMSFADANAKLQNLNETEKDNLGYYKTKLHIAFPTTDGVGHYDDCRFDIGSETNGLVEHIKEASNSWIKEEDKKGVLEVASILENSLIPTEKQKSPALQAYIANKPKNFNSFGAGKQNVLDNVEE